jgi:hypothetical protein
MVSEGKGRKAFAGWAEGVPEREMSANKSKLKKLTVVSLRADKNRLKRRPLLRYLPGGRPVESWNDWRRLV